MKGTLQRSDISLGSLSDRFLSPREISRRVSRSRRDFLRSATGAAIGSVLTSASPFVHGEKAKRNRKVIVITFGGGARDQETFAPEGQENIPHLLNELTPQSSFFTHVTNQGILGHYVATASLATGVYETLNNFAAVPPDHPTVFEYFRKDLRRPSSDTWVVAPSNGFNRIGESDYRSYGSGAHSHSAKTSAAGGNVRLGTPIWIIFCATTMKTPLYTPALERRRVRTGSAWIGFCASP